MMQIRLKTNMARCVALLFGLIAGEAVFDHAAYGKAATEEMRSEAAYSFVNGQWFDGQGFIRETWYSMQGRLTQQQPSGPIETVDLAGAYVVPPFGEAHNHNIEGEWNAQAVIARYLRDGVFYVKNPNDVRDFALKIRDQINVPRSIDVAFAHAGLTGSGGHPIALYEDVLRPHRYEPAVGSLVRGWFENRAYVVVNTEQDLHDKWPLITDGDPDFVKAYLAHSENTARRSHSGFRARAGDPAACQARRAARRSSPMKPGHLCRNAEE